ncbi:hypothetical protein CHELA1G11_50049 [Hyphomicrobiales bacterium]|nr:hypothetical protein CHELA1G11_50049 [Hyphomicrobiales bacterium]
MTSTRKPYPSYVSDEKWALVAPYLTLLPKEVGQREHSRRERGADPQVSTTVAIATSLPSRLQVSAVLKISVSVESNRPIGTACRTAP